MDKEAVSPVIGVILMVAITVVLAAVLYVWVSGMTLPSGTTPWIGMTSTADNNDGNYVNITWRIVSDRGDIKWVDITIKCLAAGESLTKTTGPPESGEFNVSDEPTGTYVEGAQTITIEFNADDLGGSKGGKKAEINLVYTPTHSTAGSNAVPAPKA